MWHMRFKSFETEQFTYVEWVCGERIGFVKMGAQILLRNINTIEYIKPLYKDHRQQFCLLLS